jgi:hypothetical protein
VQAMHIAGGGVALSINALCRCRRPLAVKLACCFLLVP